MIRLRAFFLLVLVTSASPAAAAGALDKLKNLGRDLGGTPDLLPPEKAFQVAVKVRTPDTLAAEFLPATGYYLYRNKMQFGLRDAQGAGIATVRLPKGEDQADLTFGRVEVYRKPVIAEIVLGREGNAARRIVLDATYQGCSDKGVCYPPMTRSFELLLPAIN